MIRLLAPRMLLWCGLGLLWASCSGVRYEGDLEGTRRELQAQLNRNPNDAEALRELGVLHLHTHDYPRAHEYLQQAFTRSPDDPKTLFFLGMASEAVGKQQTALRLYEQYRTVPRRSLYRQRLEGRYRYLIRELAYAEVRALLQDTTGQTMTPSPRIVAVFPLDYRGTDERYAVLGRGLGEMLTVDLASVGSLRVVERVRLQALLDEMRLAESGAVDAATAPRAGRLLGAGRVVAGSYDVLDDATLVLDAALAQADQPQDVRTPSTSGALRELFRLQDELVFRLLDEMGVEPTPEERLRIEYVPTENLQAFLAYSRGLEREDAGDFGAASRFYQQAGTMDPGFGAAAERGEAAQGASTTAGTTEEVLAEVITLEGTLTPTVDLMDNRLETLNRNLGSGFVPGEEYRKPAPDVGNAGALGLPDPPRPPQRGN